MKLKNKGKMEKTQVEKHGGKKKGAQPPLPPWVLVLSPLALKSCDNPHHLCSSHVAITLYKSTTLGVE